MDEIRIKIRRQCLLDILANGQRKKNTVHLYQPEVVQTQGI